jgi:hypothetical protein
MADVPKSNLNNDWYWPLGSLSYSPEIRDFFSEESELIGVITILWNRQELALRSIFLHILEPRIKAYAEAIWDRQPTHQSKRDLLSLAVDTAELTLRQASLLSYIIEKTKVIADRRNELIHAEYVVHGRTDVLHAKVKPPRSSKPAKYQKLSVKDLLSAIKELEELLGITEYNSFDFLGPKALHKHSKLMKELKSPQPKSGNRQSD